MPAYVALLRGVNVGKAKRVPMAALAALTRLASPPEQFAVGAYAAYLLCPNGILASKVWTVLLGRAGQTATTRNWATCLELSALLDERHDA